MDKILFSYSMFYNIKIKNFKLIKNNTLVMVTVIDDYNFLLETFILIYLFII